LVITRVLISLISLSLAESCIPPSRVKWKGISGLSTFVLRQKWGEETVAAFPSCRNIYIANSLVIQKEWECISA